MIPTNWDGSMYVLIYEQKKQLNVWLLIHRNCHVKLTKSIRSMFVIRSTIDQSQRLNLSRRSLLSPDSSLKLVYEMRTDTLISPTPLSRSRKSSGVRPSSDPVGNTSNTPMRIACTQQRKQFNYASQLLTKKLITPLISMIV